MRVFDCALSNHPPRFQRAGEALQSDDLYTDPPDGSLGCDFNLAGRLMGLLVRDAVDPSGRISGICVIRSGLNRPAGAGQAGSVADDVDSEGGGDDSHRGIPVLPVIRSISSAERRPAPGSPAAAPAEGKGPDLADADGPAPESAECGAGVPGVPVIEVSDGAEGEMGGGTASITGGSASNAVDNADNALGNAACLSPKERLALLLASAATRPPSSSSDSSSDDGPESKRAKHA
jgi:hypothetical protein